MALRVLNPRQVGTLAALPPLAAQNGHLEVVRVLLEAGADPEGSSSRLHGCWEWPLGSGAGVARGWS